jgi:hypothetical protein
MIAAVPLLCAAPASAADPAIDDAVAQAQRVLDDPRNEQVVTSIMDTMTDALLNLPVGEIEAATQGRVASPEEKRLTVRDIARRDDPQFEAKLKSRLAQSGPALRQSMRSLSAALPALAKSFEDAGKAIERMHANMPDPTYPKR